MKNIITYSDFGKHLRIGNFLYSYCFLLDAAKRYDRDLVLPDYYLWKYLKINPITVDNSAKGIEVFHFPHDGYCRDYVDAFFDKHKDKSIEINLNPFCQDFQWFEENKEYVLSCLEFKDEEIARIRENYKEVFSKPTIGISIRLGTDFTHNNGFYKVPYNFYIKALDKYFPNWRNTYNVIVFSDNINEAKNIFNGLGFMFAEHNNTHVLKYDKENFHSEKGIDHLILMSLMDNMIIGNSTFSLWGGYLCSNRKGNKEGFVIHTGKNFVGEYYERSRNNDNYYPKEGKWIKFEV